MFFQIRWSDDQYYVYFDKTLPFLKDPYFIKKLKIKLKFKNTLFYNFKIAKSSKFR